MADIGNGDLPERVIPDSKKRVVGSGSPLKFPSEEMKYFTIIKFVTYSRTNPKSPAIRVDQSDIVLPLPSNLREYYSVHYGDVEFDKLGGVVNSVDKVVDNYLQSGDLFKALEESGSAGAAVELSQALARRTASALSDDLGGVIDRLQGNIVNPHLTAVFRGVGLREHVLSWRLHARNARESRDIRKIVNHVRQRMHPAKKGDFLLDFPDEVYVKFFAGGRPFLYPIFKAVVTGVDSPQSSDGTNAFYASTDEPAVIDLTISVKEVEIATRETFDSLDSARLDTGANETPTDESGTRTTAQ